MWPKFEALAHGCPRCGAKPHKACRKLNKIGPTGYLRVPHAERRDITNETAGGGRCRDCRRYFRGYDPCMCQPEGGDV